VAWGEGDMMDRPSHMRVIAVWSVLVVVGCFCCSCDKLPFFSKEEKAGSSKIIVTRKPPPTPASQPASAAVPPSEAVKPKAAPYVYDPSGKRDPFRPFIAMQAPIMPSDQKVPLTPLQKYDLSQLKLVAILMEKDQGKAMLEDSEGKGYIVTQGTYVGNRFGKVTKIEKDQVVVEERYKDYLGAVRSKETVLQLYTPGEEKKP